MVAGLVPSAMPKGQSGEMHPLCAKKRTECWATQAAGGILMGWQRAEGWSGCPPAALGLLVLRQPQRVQSVQEVGWWGGTEGALGQH